MRILSPAAARRLFCLVPLALALLLVGCGYHTAGSATHIPASVRTIAVPVFATHSQAYHSEMALTQAVVRELNTRTRYRVLTSGRPTPMPSSAAPSSPRPRCRSPTTPPAARPPAIW